SKQRLLLLQHTARLISPGRVNRRITLLDMADDALLVDDERGAGAEHPLLVEDAVVFDGLAFEVTEEGEGNLNVFGEALVGGRAVNADAEDLSVISFEFGDISLIRL